MVNSFEKGPKSSKRSSGINFITAKKEDKLFIEQLESGKHYTYADLIMHAVRLSHVIESSIFSMTCIVSFWSK